MTVWNIGSTPRIGWSLRNPAGTLANGTVVLTLTAPDGTTSSPAVVNDSTGVYHADPTVTQAGTYRYKWTSTGAVVQAEDGAFLVAADASDFAWAPQLSDVGSRVPLRTIELGDVTGSPLGWFTTLTTPTDGQVGDFILGAVNDIDARCGTIDPSLYGLATAAAAVRAAADVELAQPAEQRDNAKYDQLAAWAVRLLDQLADRNAAITGGGTSAADALVPVYEMLAPPVYADWDM